MSTVGAVKLAQTMLNSAVDSGLRVDGVWSTATEATWNKATATMQSLIRDSVRFHEQTEVDALRTKVRPKTSTAIKRIKNVSVPTSVSRPSAYSALNVISVADAIDLANRYDSRFGLPSGTMRLMVSLEAAKAPGGYFTDARGGAGNRYLGLYQIHQNESLAWSDGKRQAGARGIRVKPMYPDGWKDAESNTIIAAGYAAMNASILKKNRIRVTPETLYASHQQGAGGFMKLAKSGKFVMPNKQSTPSVAVLQSAYNVARA